MALRIALIFGVVLLALGNEPSFADPTQEQLSALGRQLFFSTALSDDRSISCSSCHVPEHAFADPRPVSIGVYGKVGTRNAPSLIGIAKDTAFFWDGRRGSLNDVVLDPFTNPVELGLESQDAILLLIRNDAELAQAFKSTFRRSDPQLKDVAIALSSFVATLTSERSDLDNTEAKHGDLAATAQRGRELFEGVAGCVECHRVAPYGRFTDGDYHFTTAPVLHGSYTLGDLAKEVDKLSLDATALGHRVLADADWASLGRFVVTRKPNDIGAYRTPSLRNVALTAPYMHDGHIATLEEAVDHEIYYRAQQSGRVAQITQAERSAIVVFLRSLSDDPATSTSPRMVVDRCLRGSCKASRKPSN